MKWGSRVGSLSLSCSRFRWKREIDRFHSEKRGGGKEGEQKDGEDFRVKRKEVEEREERMRKERFVFVSSSFPRTVLSRSFIRKSKEREREQPVAEPD